MNPEKAEGLSPELQAALEPLLNAIESLSERVVEYNERIENLAQQSYPKVALLKQIKGVGTLIALTYMLTLEDPHRFRKSRDVGCYLGLQPGRRNSGQSEPQLHISKEGDPYVRTLLVQGAQHILGPFGIDCDLRRWGLTLAERGGRNGKKRAIVATARKLAVLLHHLWVSGEVSNRCTTAAGRPWRQPHKTKRQNKVKIVLGREPSKGPKPSFGDCVNGLAQVSTLREQKPQGAKQMAAPAVPRERPTCTERNDSLLESADGSMATAATRREEKKLV
jgi:hypothetical protein